MPRARNPFVLPQTVVNLTAAQLRALHTSPVTLVPSPGAGMLLVLTGVVCVYHFGTVAYTGGAGSSFQSNYQGDATALVTVSQLPDPVQLFSSKFGYSVGVLPNPLNVLPGMDNKALILNGQDNVGGAIATSSLGAGGANYVANDTGTITTGNGDATYQVLTVGAGGAVLTYQITNPGTGYTTGNGQATATGGAQPGVGAGLTINVNSITLPDGTMKVITYYQIIPVP